MTDFRRKSTKVGKEASAHQGFNQMNTIVDKSFEGRIRAKFNTIGVTPDTSDRTIRQKTVRFSRESKKAFENDDFIEKKNPLNNHDFHSLLCLPGKSS